MTNRSIHYLNGRVSRIGRWLICSLCLACIIIPGSAQFAPVVGYPGTTAIYWDSSAYVGWATGCTIQRGLRCLAVPDSGYATDGDSSSAIGSATQNGTVSLGDGGVAILTFASPIVDGPGFDFAVFENGFNTGPPGFAFLELGYVEVSSDGVRYVRFPAISDVQDTIQISNADAMDGSLLNNLAGKYIYGYGTPFDLDELIDSPGLDVNSITHVKVIDVVGSVDSAYGTRDSRGHLVNDPFPTNFASSGFDLDAVGVINRQGGSGIYPVVGNTNALVYPNPFSRSIEVQTALAGPWQALLTDISGRVVAEMSFEQSATLQLNMLPPGMYTIRLANAQTIITKLIAKE